ncbi:ribosomal protein S18 acetylase RimI-like enzyme [Aliiruegeria haliotis]|uniref:Ribosomal protein S18 acetylase RimI-like enzyme n=1 Tax=Aliiruegeria haliotis TaxID=1280846 RepID=A0A2T0RMT4_9RHOB|nr:GNAT family N-acetyltransferase [Aliiruegeria haliotis]PRY22505.1 ribosomal protein S18 acetylase RimI-like enzyme [Aliiruegeria haliotis]
MAKTCIFLAETEEDFASARALGFEWARTHLEEFPEHADIIVKVFDPEAYRKTMEELHILHARPKGAVLLAKLDGRPAGCVMYQPMAPGVAEIKRLFVDPAARGHGLGLALLTEMLRRMKDDGYTTARFSSAVFLLHARALYESVGFVDIPQPPDLPGYLRDHVYFMERPL